MKKIIWVFGESGTGKKTLIENILNNSNNISEYLGLNNKKIDVIKRTIDKNTSSYKDINNVNSRNDIIINKIKEFIIDDNDVLLIKGQSNDMSEKYGNTLKVCSKLFPEIEKEIFLLEVKDLDKLYKRIMNKEWFKENPIKYSKEFPREWIDNAVVNHRQEVESYKQYGYKIVYINSTAGFIKEGEKINGESCHFRR